MTDASIRTFLFLQGPHGPYFAMLADALRARGHSALRININGGDKVDWPGDASDYRGTFRNWPLFFDDFIVNHGVTDLILYGDCRPYHASAHGMARLRSVRVHVVEEGYIRPDFLTLQDDGVNGNSTLPLDPQWYLDEARKLDRAEVTFPPVPSTFHARARNTMRNGMASALMRPLFPYYRTHRPHSFIMESVAWTYKLLVGKHDAAKSLKEWEKVRGRPYFALPLQLNSDYQIRIHSPFGDMRAALRFVLKSFARHAPDDVALVVKRHPLDPGLVSWSRLTRRLAAKYGIGDRVFYLEEGDIAELVRNAEGVVTVNSTVGTLALNEGKPVTVLGHAVYKVPGIVNTGPLDAFWATPGKMDHDLYSAFRRVLMDRCLIHGGLLSEEGLTLLVDNAVRRLAGKRTPATGATIVAHPAIGRKSLANSRPST
ncbi:MULTISPECIES: capsule biosynthesis protein [Sphingomonadaceae]|uniref:Capsular polysaccharide biosynthesis protein n=1 Tax=Sphingomonas bisphenolicum TaxID=296544 RepID=A0ABM7G8U3_9SPHN|nr:MULTISPECIES: capsular biosynthesis protein [Sphingomonadaceae]MBA4090783.1 capsular biosynthesis protein [Sphingobium sp.]MBZ9648734.1 capsular biosynthesis protein [Sphingobium sp. 3R8]BBF71432.1 capsular polysaccharide biosynthesis protein [Sphingomonas bisphenolicum]